LKFINVSACYRGGLRHKFEPRYTEKTHPIKVSQVTGVPPSEFRKLFVLQIYVKDVCVWCGKEVMNEKN
jgi:hypothetical protein